MLIKERYEIIEKLGEGGMAEVYRARHLHLQRDVAIKFILSHVAADEDFDVRFKREAQAIARLSHPNIVQVHDFDHDDKRGYFMVMELLEGDDLSHYLRRLRRSEGFLSLEDVINIIRDVADGLAYAHASGIVHRDIKPSNIFITNQKRTVVTDFGIAKLTNASTITEPGMVVGTPHYFAPEIATGMPTDHRVDIYALGVVFYQLLTGKVPYDSDSGALAVISQHINAPIPNALDVRPELPAAVQAIIMKAMAKEPPDRYQDMTSFVADLDTLTGSVDSASIKLSLEDMPLPPSSGKSSRVAPEKPITATQASSSTQPQTLTITLPQRRSLLVVGIAVVVLLAAAFLLFGRGDDDKSENNNDRTSDNATPAPTNPPMVAIPRAAEGEYLYVVAQMPGMGLDNPTGHVMNAVRGGDLPLMLEGDFRHAQYNRPITSIAEADALAAETNAFMIIWGMETPQGLEVVFYVPSYPPNTMRELHFLVPEGPEFADTFAEDLPRLVRHTTSILLNQAFVVNGDFTQFDIQRMSPPPLLDRRNFDIQPISTVDRRFIDFQGALEARDYQNADRALSDLINLMPNDPSLYFLRFVLNGFFLDRVERAEQDVIVMQTLMPDNPVTAWALGIVYLAQNDYDRILAVTEDFSSDNIGTQTFIQIDRQMAFLMLGEFEQAVTELEAIDNEVALELFSLPVKDLSVALLAEIRHDTATLETAQASIRANRRIETVSSGFLGSEVIGTPTATLVWFGYVTELNGTAVVAISAYERAIEADPNAYIIHWRLAISHAQEGDYQAAYDSYQQALDTAPQPFPIAAYQLAQLIIAHEDALSDPLPACEVLQTASELANTNPEFYALLLPAIADLQAEIECEIAS